jgi:rfaE bifunctional protein nucleotidyltransferase chain/domain
MLQNQDIVGRPAEPLRQNVPQTPNHSAFSILGNKTIRFEDAGPLFEKLKKCGKKIVHCHGAFDLIHPGHVSHLEEARKMGDVLVVSITAAPYVNKGPGRPVYNDEQRMAFLAALQVVDYVVLVPFPGAIEVIGKIRPDIYCKGLEYADPQNKTDQRIHEDILEVRKYDGDVKFVGSPLYSSSKLLNTFFETIDPTLREYLGNFPEGQAIQKIDESLEKISKLKVLVVGDLIADRYIYSTVQGLTSKARILSVRPKFEETYMGGAFAIARHVQSFASTTHLVSLSGKESWLKMAMNQDYGKLDTSLLISDEDYQTVVKERFVEQPGQRKDLIKIFAVNRLVESPTLSQKRRLISLLKKILPEYDVVILADYGHGMIDDGVQQILEQKSPWLALNCQTNSYNHGYNLITKYRRCDLFSLDEAEIRLAFANKTNEPALLLKQLVKLLRPKSGHLTLGSAGSLLCKENEVHACPAVTRSTVDTVGAGDAYFAVASLFDFVEAGPAITSFMGNVAGGMAANIIGNKDAIESRNVAKNAMFMLKSCSSGA